MPAAVAEYPVSEIPEVINADWVVTCPACNRRCKTPANAVAVTCPGCRILLSGCHCGRCDRKFLVEDRQPGEEIACARCGTLEEQRTRRIKTAEFLTGSALVALLVLFLVGRAIFGAIIGSDSTSSDDPAYQLAALDAGGEPSEGAVSAMRAALDAINGRCKGTYTDTGFADSAQTMHEFMDDNGVYESRFSILINVRQAISGYTGLTCDEAFAAYATLRIGN